MLASNLLDIIDDIDYSNCCILINRINSMGCGSIRMENYSLSGDMSKYVHLQPDDLVTWPKNSNRVCLRAI